jgi:hypothetical protein
MAKKTKSSALVSRTARGVLLVVLALAAGSSHADAQRLTCFTIRPGDTVARAAIRLTGAAENRHRAWFQIIDPATRRVVAKSQYDRVHAGWRACVAQETRAIRSTALVRPAPATGTSMIARMVGGVGVAPALWVVVIVAAACLWNACDQYLAERRRTLDAMRWFGQAFVREFERPLLQLPPAPSPIRARLRARPGRGRVEVLLAPGHGRRYPNLTDHKANLTYDVARIMQGFRDQPFTCVPPYADGPWVVVPFLFQSRPTQAGTA